MLRNRKDGLICYFVYPALLLSEMLELAGEDFSSLNQTRNAFGQLNLINPWSACVFPPEDGTFRNYCIAARTPIEALATYLLREGKFNNNAK